jgi:hypothetical protein
VSISNLPEEELHNSNKETS